MLSVQLTLMLELSVLAVTTVVSVFVGVFIILRRVRMRSVHLGIVSIIICMNFCSLMCRVCINFRLLNGVVLIEEIFNITPDIGRNVFIIK